MFDATPALRAYARFRARQLDALNPIATQERQLRTLLRKAKDTAFGRDHGFASIQTVEQYQRSVPLRTYEKFWTEYWQPAYPRLVDCTWPGTIPFFPVSSGTTSGITKYIPCSEAMIRSNNKAGTDLLVHHVRNRPNSRLLGGKSFMLGGSTDLTSPSPGIFQGDLSGIAVQALPWWARLRYFPPKELALIKDWEEKVGVLATRSLVESIRMISGVPTWLLIFFDKLFEIRPRAEGRLAGVYPELEMLVHGGVNFAPYKKRFDELLRGSRAELREVYPASEGFVAVADRGPGEGLRMNLDHGIFFEFVPVDELDAPHPTRHWIKNVERNVQYAIVMSTCAGLWSYILGDTVTFVDSAPHRVLVTGRTAQYLSPFGEHVITEELEDAVAVASAESGLTVNDFSVQPIYPSRSGELGGHLYIVEFDGRMPEGAEKDTLAQLIDIRLSTRNEDYDAHRAKGFGLRAPTIWPVRSGTFAAWMKSRGKLGGQNKVPRIITNDELARGLREFCGVSLAG